MAADLDAMAAMLDASLDYLRGLQDSEPARPIDVNALLQTLVEDNAVQGRELGLAGEADKPYPGRLAALQRAVQNLIDNFQWPVGAAQALVLAFCGMAAVFVYARISGLFTKGIQ